MLIPYFDPLEKWISTAGQDEQTVLLLRDARELMTEMLFVRKDFLMGRLKQSEAGLRVLIDKFGLKDADLTLLQPFL